MSERKHGWNIENMSTQTKDRPNESAMNCNSVMRALRKRANNWLNLQGVEREIREIVSHELHTVLNIVESESMEDDLLSALKFMRSQLESLAKVHWPHHSEEFLEKCDAYNCANLAIDAAEKARVAK